MSVVNATLTPRSSSDVDSGAGGGKDEPMTTNVLVSGAPERIAAVATVLLTSEDAGHPIDRSSGEPDRLPPGSRPVANYP